MTIAILAHDSRKELALQFCTAYSGILSRNTVIATGTTGRMLAQATGLSQTHIGQIVRGKRRITPDAGLRIARALGVSDRYWIDQQANYDTLVAKIAHAAELAAIEPIVAA